MPNYTTTGRIKAILPAEQRGDYTIRKIALEIPGYKDRKEYPCFEFFGKNSEKLQGFREGETAEITWELKGNESKGKYYTTCSGFKIERVPSQAASRPEDDYERNRPSHERSDRERARNPQPAGRNDGPDEYDF